MTGPPRRQYPHRWRHFGHVEHRPPTRYAPSGSTCEADEAGRLLLDCLHTLEALIHVLARKQRLGYRDVEEFTSWVLVRLVEREYAILRKFRGGAPLGAYLRVVVRNLLRDYQDHVLGKWRSSARAARLGPVAVRLERLLVRDGCSLREAIGILRHAGVSASEGELACMAAVLSARSRQLEISLDEAMERELATDPILGIEDGYGVLAALEAALADLSPHDRAITRMHYWELKSVAEIARASGLKQKPLYRLLESIQRRLKQRMLQQGITQEMVADVLTRGTCCG